MSIRHSLLALLSEGPQYGAQLRSEFERRTGGTWPLNIGQVYTTLARLERDGLVGTSGADRTIEYRLTEAGEEEIRAWWQTPVDRDAAPRNELVIKLALAVTVDGVDVGRVVSTQRAASMRSLQELTRLKRASAEDRHSGLRDLAWDLVIENLIFTAEAELRWLDHVESRVTGQPRARRKPVAPVTEAERVSR
jgi:DNA-binding PadR family transcriptional regulator